MKKIPWIVWAALLAALILQVLQWTSGGKRVPVVGGGPVAAITAEQAPPGVRFDVEASASASLEDAEAQVRAAIRTWPDVLVFGLPGTGAEVLEPLAGLAHEAENATAVPVVVGPRQLAEAQRGLFTQICRAGPLRLCVDASRQADDAALGAAIVQAVRDGLSRHAALRATTQAAQ